MFGKASIFLVLGFSTIFMFYNRQMLQSATDTTDIYSSYYTQTVAQSIATSGANMACNMIYFTPNWNTGFSNVSFQGGTLNLSVATVGVSQRRITAIGAFNGFADTVIVTMQPSNFAKFCYYAAQMPGNLYYATGDTVWGPTHIQGKLNVAGSPVFYGKVTSQNGLKYLDGSTNPKFYGGYESGVNLPLPTNLTNLQSAASSGGFYTSGSDVTMTFNADATVTIKVGSAAATTRPISTVAPNGVFYVDRGNLRIKGTVKGKVTVAAAHSSGMGSGNVFIDGDVTYSTDPTRPGCTDMLGIVSSNNVIIADVPGTKGDINIHASIIGLSGGLQVENYNRIGYQGSIKLVGGLIESQAQATGVYSGGRVTSGYNSNFRYDDRFMLEVPPAYPATGSYEIVSWCE